MLVDYPLPIAYNFTHWQKLRNGLCQSTNCSMAIQCPKHFLKAGQQETWTWVICYGYQCKILCKILCIVLTGMPKYRTIQCALHVCTTLFLFCHAVTTSANYVEAIDFFPLSGFSSNDLVASNIIIVFYRTLVDIVTQIFFHFLKWQVLLISSKLLTNGRRSCKRASQAQGDASLSNFTICSDTIWGERHVSLVL